MILKTAVDRAYFDLDMSKAPSVKAHLLSGGSVYHVNTDELVVPMELDDDWFAGLYGYAIDRKEFVKYARERKARGCAATLMDFWEKNQTGEAAELDEGKIDELCVDIAEHHDEWIDGNDWMATYEMLGM